MEKETLKIPNISCGHCTGTIESELKEMKGISNVSGNIAEKSVTVEFEAPASLDQIVERLQEINYPAKTD